MRSWTRTSMSFLGKILIWQFLGKNLDEFLGQEPQLRWIPQWVSWARISMRFCSNFFVRVSTCSSSGVAMVCADCAKHKGPQPSRGPSNPWGPQQSEVCPKISGVHQSEEPPAIWGAPAIRGAPGNLRGPQQSRGSPTIRGAASICGAPSNLRPQQSEGPTAIWRAPGNLTGPSNWGSDPRGLRAVVISLNLSSNVNHFLNCSTARWLHYALSSTLSDVCTVPHVVADTRTIIFKIEGHQKLYEVPCQKSGWATWQLIKIVPTHLYIYYRYFLLLDVFLATL